MSSITYEVTVSEYRTDWKLNGKYHREDGPAIEYADGDKFWCLNGKYHRTDGPAVEYADGDKSWWINDQLHREDGPAIEYVDGNKFWYLNGENMTEEEHRIRTQPAVELTIAQIEQLLGKKIKVVK